MNSLDGDHQILDASLNGVQAGFNERLASPDRVSTAALYRSAAGMKK